jgi:hypothetical protein
LLGTIPEGDSFPAAATTDRGRPFRGLGSATQASPPPGGMMVFLAVLTIGFIYEWKKGALEWD